MADMNVQRFPIRFDNWYVILSIAVLVPPSSSWVELDDQEVRVQMGWAFRARFPRTAVVAVTEMQSRPMSRGVHACAGGWLVNGSGQGILTIDLIPTQRAYVIGFPLKLKKLMVSVTKPQALATALTFSSPQNA